MLDHGLRSRPAWQLVSALRTHLDTGHTLTVRVGHGATRRTLPVRAVALGVQGLDVVTPEGLHIVDVVGVQDARNDRRWAYRAR